MSYRLHTFRRINEGKEIVLIRLRFEYFCFFLFDLFLSFEGLHLFKSFSFEHISEFIVSHNSSS